MYWQKLNALGINPTKYSWRFDRDAECRKVFERSESSLIERGVPFSYSLKGVFLARMAGRGFSDQTNVPDDVHRSVFKETMDEAYAKYGNLIDTAEYRAIEDDIVITEYVK